jgi:prepilin-type processing-associated H-X9-DG protein
VKVLQCPSAEANRLGEGLPSLEGDAEGACTDYAVTLEIAPNLIATGLIDSAGNYQGVLARGHMTLAVEITDGTSNTTLAAECADRPRRWQAGQYHPELYSVAGPWATPANRISLSGSDPTGSPKPGPCALNCTNNQEMYSLHPGGGNFLFADGSVRFLHAGISIRIMARLITQAGGEVVAPDDY